MNTRARCRKQFFYKLEQIQTALREPRTVLTVLDSYIMSGVNDCEKLDAVQDLVGILCRELQNVSDMIENMEYSLLPEDKADMNSAGEI